MDVASLPPRIDPGENIDDVLGEVSKLFGKSIDHHSSLAALASDEISDQLSQLAPDPSITSQLAEARTTAPISLETAADLFRAAPQNPPTSKPPIDATEEEEAVPGGSSGIQFSPGPASLSPTVNASNGAADGNLPASTPVAAEPCLGPLKKFLNAGRQIGNASPRVKLSAALIAAALVGWLGGAFLSARRSEKTNGQEANASQHGPDAAGAANLDNELKTALRERDQAQQQRRAADEQLQQARADAQSAHRAAQAELDREQAARRRAEEHDRQVQAEARLLRLRAYDLQLARVRETWRSNPGMALALLNNQESCPPDLRDFTWGYFYSRVKSDRGTIITHATAATAIAWSSDGHLIAVGGQDGSIKFIDAASCQQLGSVQAHSGETIALAFAAQAGLLASCGDDGTVKLWDAVNRKILTTFLGHVGAVRGIAIAPDGTALASTGDDGTVKFWTTESHEPIATRWRDRPRGETLVGDQPRTGGGIVYSPDGRLVASGGHGIIRIWTIPGAEEKTSIWVPEGDVTALAFGPSGTTIAGGADGAIRCWDLQSTRPQTEPAIIKGQVHGLLYSPDGRYLAAAIEEGALLFRMPVRPAGAEGMPDRSVTSGDQTAFGIDTPTVLRGHAGAVNGVAFSPDSETLATCGADGTTRFWDPGRKAFDKTQPDAVIRCRPNPVSLAYSPDGARLAAAGDAVISIWDLSNGVETMALRSRSGAINGIAFSPDGTCLASASADWPILVWDLSAQRIKSALNGHTGAVNSVAFSPDGKFLLSAGDDGTVRYWDAVRGHECAVLPGHAGRILTAVISPDGKLAAAAGSDGTVQLWQIAPRRQLTTLAGEMQPVTAIAFSPDDKVLLSAAACDRHGNETAASSQMPLASWSIEQHRIVLRFGTPGSAIRAIAYSHDGKTVAASDDHGVTLWDAASGALGARLEYRGAGSFGSVRFSPNDLTLAAAAKDAIVLWTVAPFTAAHEVSPAAH